VLALKKILALYFLLPCLAFYAVLFQYFFRNPAHAVMHVAVLGLLCYFFLQVLFALQPQMPFSQPRRRGEQTRRLALVFLAAPALTVAMMDFMSRFVYPSGTRYGISLGALLVIVSATERSFGPGGLLGTRIAARLEQLQFAW